MLVNPGKVQALFASDRSALQAMTGRRRHLKQFAFSFAFVTVSIYFSAAIL